MGLPCCGRPGGGPVRNMGETPVPVETTILTPEGDEADILPARTWESGAA
jgi:hypothetical protein